MSLRLKLLHKLTDRLRVKDIRVQGRPYLERYYLGTLFGVEFFIHRFRSSDPENEVHDHPWGWAMSVILLGYYHEETLKKEAYEKKAAGRISLIRGTKFHRVHILNEQDTWTLFFHGPRTKGWGFFNRRTNEYRVFAKDANDHPDHKWWTNPNGMTGKCLRLITKMTKDGYDNSENKRARPT
jgi:hypothetical protein